jgi:glutamine amidotransferase
MITIINYGMGNLGSIANMLKKIGEKALITSDKGVVASAEKLILPGVGAFDNAITNLRTLGLIEVLNKKVLEDKVPIFGICLGIQLFTKRSDEGTLPGLGWIDAETVSFAKHLDTAKNKIPHMGWNTVEIKKDHLLFNKQDQDLRFYFVHSFFLQCASLQDVLTTTTYGVEFVSSVQKENIMGVQFHPEKSHRFGMTLLRRFAEL